MSQLLNRRILLFLLISVMISPKDQPIAQEHRGIWVSDFVPDDSSSLDMAIQNAFQANFNVLYPYTYCCGMGLYKSDLSVPWEGIHPHFDVLDYIVTHGQALGFDIHPWLVIGWMPLPDSTSSNILARHPDWGLEDASGFHAHWIDYSNPEATTWLLAVIEEINDNYDIKGIHLDYIRYPDSGIGCWCTNCLAAYDSIYGSATLPPPKRLAFPTYGEYQAWSVGEATTATELTEFTDGNKTWPAVLLNRRGAGKCLLINWNPAFEDGRGLWGGSFFTIFSNALSAFLTQASSAAILLTDYHDWSAVATRLDWMKIPYFYVDSTEISSLPLDRVLVCPKLYYLSIELIEDIDNWVQAGGSVIFIGGVTGSIKNPALQALIGGRSEIYEYKVLVQQAVGEHPWIPTEPPDTIFYAEAVTEINKWNSLQESILTNFVRRIYNLIHKYPDRYLSAAVYPSVQAGHYVMQDWSNWLPNTLDYVLPMSYLDNNDWFKSYCNLYQSLDLLETTRCFPGIGASYPGLTPHQIAQQIRITRETGANGQQLFSNYSLTAEVIDTLSNGVYSNKVRPTYPNITGISGNHSQPKQCNFFLYPNYPNPFNSSTNIKFYLHQDAYVEIEIYNIRGQQIRVLIRGEKTTGYYIISWDGMDNNGFIVSSGIYFFQVKISHKLKTVGKALFLK